MRIAWIVVGALALLLLAGSFYVVDENEVALLSRFGRVVQTDVGPGLHFKIPLVDSAQAFDRRIRTLDPTPEKYLTKEKKDVGIDCFVAWRIADLRRYYTATQGVRSEAEQHLSPIVAEALRGAIGQRTLQDLVALDRDPLDGETLRQVNRATRDALGIEVLDVRIKRVDLPEDGNVLATVYERMKAERERLARQTRAEGDEESAKIKARADQERMVTLAQAEGEAQTLRGEGDAEAASIAAQAYGQDPEFYAFYSSLRAYRKMFGGKDVLVLDPDSELMHYLTNPGRGSAPKN